MGKIAESEEAWWLRRVCQRSHCCCIRMLATKFGLRVPSVKDVLVPHSKGSAVLQAVPTTDLVTCHSGARHYQAQHGHSDCPQPCGRHNTPDLRTNGMLCQMHPAEGYWLFRGAPRRTDVYGAMFGSHQVCWAFPTRSPCLAGRHSNSITVQDGQCTLRMGGQGKRQCMFRRSLLQKS